MSKKRLFGNDTSVFFKNRLLCIFRLTKATFSCNIIFVFWGYSSAGRALEWHSRGQEFEPPYLHQKKATHHNLGYGAFFMSPFRQTKNSGSIPLISTRNSAVGNSQRLFLFFPSRNETLLETNVLYSCAP